MADMSDVKVLSKITGRKVDPNKMEDIKKAIFMPDLPDMGDVVSLMREYNDGKKKNSKKQGKGCDHRAQSTYGNVYIVGNNDEVCAPFKEIGKIILDKDGRLFRMRKMHKQIVEKHLKKSKPAHLKKGKIRLPQRGRAVRQNKIRSYDSPAFLLSHGLMRKPRIATTRPIRPIFQKAVE